MIEQSELDPVVAKDAIMSKPPAPPVRRLTEIQRLVRALAEHGGPMTVGELVEATGIKKEQVHSRCSTSAKAGQYFVRTGRGTYD